MAFIFSPVRVAELRQQQRRGQISATLVLVSESVLQERVRHFQRRFMTHDADGRESGWRQEPVQDVGLDKALRPALLTILLVEMLDVYAERATDPLRAPDLEVAQACGFKTVGELQTDWKALHPRSEFAKLVWFCLGDVRDRDRYLRRYISRGGDYSGHRGDDTIDELPALSEAQLQELAAGNHQRFVRQRADQAKDLAELTLAQRVARIEASGEDMRRECRNELRIIAERSARGHKKLAP